MVDFNELITKFVHRELRGKTIGRYYPSEAGNCKRKTYYSYKIPKETDVEVLKVFEMGNMVHELIVKVLQSEKTPDIELLGKEIPFKIDQKDFIISGRIDDMILVKIENERYIVEVKSTSALKFTENPNPGHISQLQLYMHASGIHKGIILYIEKNTLQAKHFFIDYSPKKVENSIERINEIHKSLTSDTLPEPEARLVPGMNWMCRYCNYKDECYEATPEEELRKSGFGISKGLEKFTKEDKLKGQLEK
jgi:CRISPR/Cas system-associated exonuclease Cas4 (RecB family)